jgi:hypothetical protein
MSRAGVFSHADTRHNLLALISSDTPAATNGSEPVRSSEPDHGCCHKSHTAGPALPDTSYLKPLDRMLQGMTAVARAFKESDFLVGHDKKPAFAMFLKLEDLSGAG